MAVETANRRTETVTILSPKLKRKLNPSLNAKDVSKLLLNNSRPWKIPNSKACLASSADVAVIFTKNWVCFQAPVESITNAVMVQMMRVSIKGPSIATAPSLTG